MSKRTIDLGYIHMSSWTPTSRLGSDYHFDPNNVGYNDKHSTAIRALDPDEVVLKSRTYTLGIDYPLSNPYRKTFEVAAKGMTRRQLVNHIVEAYKAIYEAEENPGEIPGMLNRSTSEGPYGIWGHHMSDLMLHTAHVNDTGLVEVRCDS